MGAPANSTSSYWAADSRLLAFIFFFNDTAPTEISTLSLHDALPILPHPPGGVGRELVSAAVLELVHRPHQADVALLDQVQKLQPAIVVALGNAHHQPQVGLDQFALGGLGFTIGLGDDRRRAP